MWALCKCGGFIHNALVHKWQELAAGERQRARGSNAQRQPLVCRDATTDDRYKFFPKEYRRAGASKRGTRTPWQSASGARGAPYQRPQPPPPRAPPSQSAGDGSSDMEAQALRAMKCLKEHFGLSEFWPGQLEVILRVLQGHSSLAIFPTGGGKSLCFQVPAMLLDGLTLVVSPLIALMRDHVEMLQNQGIPAMHIHSGMSAPEVRQTYRLLSERAIRILFVAPERFVNEKFRQVIARLQVSLFVVDEAHCLSEWGHTFRPEYLLLRQFAQGAGARVCLALTATATTRVVDDICRHFHIHSENVIRASVHRPNLTLRCTPVGEFFGTWSPDTDKDGRLERRVFLLVERLLSRPRGSTIVYVTTQKTATAVAELLVTMYSLPAVAYHAGMTTEERASAQNIFMSGRDTIIVATIAFGMGIHKQEVRYVYLFNISKSIEAYTQSIGRAGRDGEPAICELFLCADDLPALESFVLSSTPSRRAVHTLLESLFGSTVGLAEEHMTASVNAPESPNIRYMEKIAVREDQVALSFFNCGRALDIEETTIRVLLAFLDLKGGFIEEQTAYYAHCEVDLLPNTSVEETLHLLRRDVSVPEGVWRAARLILNPSVKVGRRRTSDNNLFMRIDIHDVVRARTAAFAHPVPSGATTRELVYSALELLQSLGIVRSIKFSHLYHVFRIVAKPSDMQQLADDLYRSMLRREQQELFRIRATAALFLGAEPRPGNKWVASRGSRCFARSLCAHYNEILVHKCGRCELCLAAEGALGETPGMERLRERILNGGSTELESLNAVLANEKWQQLIVQVPVLRTCSRLLARFAWGATSPKILSMKLQAHPLFGCLQGRYRYEQVLEAAEHLLQGDDLLQESPTTVA